MLSNKAGEAGRIMVKVNPAYTSQTCSRCQYRCSGEEKLTLKDRVFLCPRCGLEIDRDLNAAKNILAAGLPNLSTYSLLPQSVAKDNSSTATSNSNDDTAVTGLVKKGRKKKGIGATIPVAMPQEAHLL
jgi:transposase